jgi:DNA polymerase bacteriophage-type
MSVASAYLSSHCDLDFETASAADLKEVGVYRYAEHPSTKIWLFSYRFDDGPVARWLPGMPPPSRLLEHLSRGGQLVAHNAAFERRIWNAVLRHMPECSLWPQLEIKQCDCTMARALAIHLPADLDDLAVVLSLTERKDKEGKALMRRMAKIRNPPTVWTAADIERLGAYCDMDVIVESAINKVLLPLSADERTLYELDQRINDRGARVDLGLVRKIVKVLEVAKARDNARMADLTAGAVAKTTQNKVLLEWFQGRGFVTDSIAKGSHADLRAWADVLGDDEAAVVLELRASGAKTSVAKYDRMTEYAGADDRMRGLFGYHRASTGRWGGSGPQPQNLPRVDEDTELPDVMALIQILEGAEV